MEQKPPGLEWKGTGRPPAGWPKDARGRPLAPDVVAAMDGVPPPAQVPAPAQPKHVPAYRKAPDPRYVDTGFTERSHAPGPGSGGVAYSLNEAGLELVTTMAREGNAAPTIALALGMNPTTFAHLRKRQPAVQAALDAGLGGLQDELVDILLQKARKGDIVATIYLAKARCGLFDRPHEAKGNDAPTVNLTINAPLTDQQFEKLVHIETTAPKAEEPE